LATSMRNEIDEIPLTVEASNALGVPAELWSAERVNETLSSEGFGPGRFTAAEGQIDPMALCQKLVSRATAAGAGLFVNAPVKATTDLADGVSLTVGASGQTLQVEMVILAAGAQLHLVDPWMGDKVYPVRTQMMTLDTPTEPFHHVGSALYGHLFWRRTAEGLLVGGCRWATPHLEVGETDDSVTVPKIEETIRAVFGQRFPDRKDAPAIHRWTGIMSFTCDLLPILGPIPGRPRYIACGGFNGRQESFGLRAAQAVCQGVLEGNSPGVPEMFKTRRFVE